MNSAFPFSVDTLLPGVLALAGPVHSLVSTSTQLVVSASVWLRELHHLSMTVRVGGPSVESV